MVTRAPKEQPQKKEFASQDLRDLRAALGKLEQIKIEGKYRSRFDQFLEKMNIIKFSDGEMVVTNPQGYHHWNEIHSYMQSQDWYALQDTFQQFPEEKEAFTAMVRSNRPNFTIKRMPQVADYE